MEKHEQNTLKTNMTSGGESSLLHQLAQFLHFSAIKRACFLAIPTVFHFVSDKYH